MTVWIAIILGVVQGLTEFLPISSSGHLVLLQQIFGINNNCLLFDIVLHLGTLLAVIIIYRKQIFNIIKHPFCEMSQKLIFATLPTIIIVLLLKDFYKNSFDGGLLELGFFVTAIYMFIAHYICKKNYQYKKMTFGNSIVIGIFQGLAIMPGISRSGSTIAAGLVQGVRRDECAEFSFLLSIPIILGSLVFELFDVPFAAQNISFLPLFAGFVASAIFGYLSIKLMLKVIRKAKFAWFGIYLIILAIFVTLNKYVFFLF